MLVSQGIIVCMEYHKAHSKPYTMRSYDYILGKFRDQYEGRDIKSFTSEEMLTFLNRVCSGT
jgi:hypothetical protein